MDTGIGDFDLEEMEPLEAWRKASQDPDWVKTIALQTSDGGFASWDSGRVETRTVSEEQTQALAEFSASLEESPPPERVVEAVKVLGGLMEARPSSDLRDFEELIELLAATLEAAEIKAPTWKAEDSVAAAQRDVEDVQAEARAYVLSLRDSDR